MKTFNTLQEIEALVGENVRNLRLQRNMSQAALAEQAGVSVTALKNLENGSGVALKTLIAVVRALDKEDWLHALAPVATINPLQMVRNKPQRQRASGLRTKHGPQT